MSITTKYDESSRGVPRTQIIAGTKYTIDPLQRLPNVLIAMRSGSVEPSIRQDIDALLQHAQQEAPELLLVVVEHITVMLQTLPGREMDDEGGAKAAHHRRDTVACRRRGYAVHQQPSPCG